MTDFEEFAERLAITRVLVDGSLLQLTEAVVIYGQRATATGKPGHTWWRIEGTIATPLNASPDVAVSFDLEGVVHAGRGSVESGPVPVRRIGGKLQVDAFPLTIHGSGDLDPGL